MRDARAMFSFARPARGVLFAAYAAVLVSFPAGAINGDMFVVQCDTCTIPYDFSLKGLQTAQQLVMPGTYIVTSNATARSAYVRVTGYPGTVCDFWGECEVQLINAHSTVVTESGSTAVDLGDLERMDETLFNLNRSQQIAPINLPPEYGSSFINSVDETVIGGISRALLMKGINPNFLPRGTLVLVKFPDGTSAVYKKICHICSLMWEWTGTAWNANGQRIKKNGSLVNNPNTAGVGGGSAAAYGIGTGIGGSSGSDIRFDLVAYNMCSSSLSLYIRGELVWTTMTHHPC